MGKLYTLDNKLLTELPEIRVGEKIYPVDNRQKTVEAVTKIMDGVGDDGKKDAQQNICKALELALGTAPAKEIDEMNMPFPAYQQLFELVTAAMTGESPAKVAARFREEDIDE